MSTRFRVSALCVLILACLSMSAPIAAESRPRTLEETLQLATPVPAFPLTAPAAIHGDSIVAGSSAVVNGTRRCAVFLFERPSGTQAWAYARTLIDFPCADDYTENLSVSIHENTVAVSAVDVAYAIERGPSEWTTSQLAKPPTADNFGSSIAIAGDTVIVGGTANGQVAGFIFRKNAAGMWLADGHVLGDAVPTTDASYFGPAVDVSLPYWGSSDPGPTERVFLGSPDNELDGDHPGHLFIFKRVGAGEWALVSRETDGYAPSGPRAAEAITVRSEGQLAAYSSGVLGGISFLMEENTDSWWNPGGVRLPDAAMNGPEISLDLSDEGRLLVGTPGDEDRGAEAGSVTLIRFVGEDPFIEGKLYASDATSGARLGHSVAVHGNTAIARGADRIYVYALPEDLTEPSAVQDDFEDGDTMGWLPTASTWRSASSGESRVYEQWRAEGDRRTTLDGVDWPNIGIQADVRAIAFDGSDRWFGLMARYVDASNHYYVALRNTNRVQLVRRLNGANQVLASKAFTVTPNSTYRVRLEAVGSWLRVYIDGTLLLQARDSGLTHGTAGLRTVWTAAHYDNIVVSPAPALTLFQTDFEDGGTAGLALQPQSGWSNVAGGGGRVLRQTFMDGAARAIAGVDHSRQDEFADHIVEARARAIAFIPGRDPWFGLIARYLDDENYTYITVNRNGYVSLRRLNDGIIQVFDTAPMTVTQGAWYRFRLEAIGDRLRVYVDGTLMLEAIDDAISNDMRGRYGLMTSRSSAEFDDVRVTRP